MGYQLDTDVIIYHLRGQKQLNPNWLNKDTAISVITLGELLYGAQKSNQVNKSISIVKSFLDDFNLKVIPLDSKLIESYSHHKAKLEKAGNKLDDFDLLIGITAKENNLILATNNHTHFQRINGLKLDKQ